MSLFLQENKGKRYLVAEPANPSLATIVENTNHS